MDSKKDLKELVLRRVIAIYESEDVAKKTAVPLGPDDVVVCSGPKSGSTWMQQILHGLRSGGDMDFEDINTAVPVIDFPGVASPGHLEKQVYEPRLFKTHAYYQNRPTGAKTIVMTRDPNDAVLSYYYYFANWLFSIEEMGIDEFIDLLYCQTCPVTFSFNAEQLHHLASWYPHRNDKDVLWLHYEDLKADLKKCIGLISSFVGIGVGDHQLLDLVERQASLEFMKRHDSKFDSSALKMSLNEAAGLPKNAGLDTHVNSGKIRKGRVGESREALSQAAKKTMDKLWGENVKPVTGFDNYEEMRASVNKELKRVF